MAVPLYMKPALGNSDDNCMVTVSPLCEIGNGLTPNAIPEGRIKPGAKHSPPITPVMVTVPDHVPATVTTEAGELGLDPQEPPPH